MSSTNKTSLGLNMWEASDKPVRNDFVNDNVIIDKELSNLKKDVVNGNTAIDEKINQLNSNLAKTRLSFITGVDVELTSNSTYEENGRLYIDLALKNLTAFTPNTSYYLGQLVQGPKGVKTVIARTNGNYLFSGWIDGGGNISLYNRTGQIIPAGEIFQILSLVSLEF